MAEAPSDPPRNKPDRKDLKKSLPRAAQKLVNEDDLWDFADDEASPSVKTSSSTPNDEPIIETLAESPESTNPASLEPEEEVLRIETPISHRRTQRGQRRNLANKHTASWSLTQKSIPQSPTAEEAPLVERFTPASSGIDAVEEEVWQALDDEDIPSSHAPDPTDSHETDSLVAEIEEIPSEAPVETLTDDHAPAESWQDDREIVEEVISPPSDDSSTIAPDDEPPVPEAPCNPASAANQVHPLSWKRFRLTRLELVSSMIFVAFLIAVSIAGIMAFRANVKVRENPYRLPELPAQGQYCTITSAETFWRAPIRSGANPDSAQLDVILIPSINIQLGKCSAPSGTIRVVFYNDKGEIAGDTVTRSYRDHLFAQNGESTLNFSSTKGFLNFGEQEAYRAYLVKPWTARIYEGPSDNATSSQFQLLFTTPISTKIR